MSSPRVAVGRGLGDDVVHTRPAPQAEQHDPTSFETHLLELDFFLRLIIKGDGVRAALAAASTFNSLYKQVIAAACFDALEERAVVVARNPLGHDAADLETFPRFFLALPGGVFLLAHAASTDAERERARAPGSARKTDQGAARARASINATTNDLQLRVIGATAASRGLDTILEGYRDANKCTQ